MVFTKRGFFGAGATFGWLDEEATDDVVAGNNHGERGVTENKSFDDGVCLGLMGGQDTWDDNVDIPLDLCIGAEGVGRFEENAGGMIYWCKVEG